MVGSPFGLTLPLRVAELVLTALAGAVTTAGPEVVVKIPSAPSAVPPAVLEATSR